MAPLHSSSTMAVATAEFVGAYPLLDPPGTAQDGRATAFDIGTIMLDPKGIADGEGPAQDGGATAVVDTSIRRGVKIWFETRGGTWVLRTSRLETPDPYGGGRPIRLFPEVLCAHENKVLFRLRSPHSAVPTESFVYSFPTSSSAGAGCPSVVRLPPAVPEIESPQAVGILRGEDGKSFVVASLWQKSNPETRKLDSFLHLWCYSSSLSKWTQQRVDLPFGDGTRGWRTDRVIAMENTLLWVNVQEGILLCRNLGHSNAEFHFVGLPSKLPRLAYPRGKARAELFRGVGCCNGKIKLVNLHYISGPGSSLTLKVAIWNLQTSYQDGEFIWKWNRENRISSCSSLDCQILFSDMNAKLQHTDDNSLPPWSNRLPCLPVLSKDKINILYLTVAAERNERAWLLQIDMQANTALKVKDVADYPGFCRHMKPPYPSDLSKYNPTPAE